MRTFPLLHSSTTLPSTGVRRTGKSVLSLFKEATKSYSLITRDTPAGEDIFKTIADTQPKAKDEPKAEDEKGPRKRKGQEEGEGKGKGKEKGKDKEAVKAKDAAKDKDKRPLEVKDEGPDKRQKKEQGMSNLFFFGGKKADSQVS